MTKTMNSKNEEAADRKMLAFQELVAAIQETEDGDDRLDWLVAGTRVLAGMLDDEAQLMDVSVDQVVKMWSRAGGSVRRNLDSYYWITIPRELDPNEYMKDSDKEHKNKYRRMYL